jgi:LytS/YehU family sensor histidine kinase
MTLIESYIQLEGLRLPGRIAYSISVDKSIGTQSTYVPSMLLQPVVENAIWHGIAHRENESMGNISINVKQDNDQLLCTIEDNGVGRDRSRQLHDNSVINHRALGMKITEERLRIRNRKHNGQCIEITDLKDNHNDAVGTRVILYIPIAEQND